MEDDDQMNIYENDIDLYLHQFMEERGIEDFRKETQATWNACLMFIQRNVFYDKSKLKIKNNIYTENTITPTNCNAYDIDLIDSIADYYIYICYLYNKECSLSGFSKLTKIHIDTLIDWGKLSTSSCEIYKKLMRENEECYSNNLYDGKKNPVGSFGVLKNRHGWDSPLGISHEPVKKSLKLDDLPQLGQVKDLIDD